jgi:hypothetical protein
MKACPLKETLDLIHEELKNRAINILDHPTLWEQEQKETLRAIFVALQKENNL